MTHGALQLQRGLGQNLPRSAFAKTGVFGRMFPTLDVQNFDDALLERLAAAMEKKVPAGGADNATISAGYTFLGQFIDHDLTFDPTSSLERQNDPDAIWNFRTPAFELDNVYGSGPLASPHLYDGADFGKFIIGRDAADVPESDLPRNTAGTALIGDPRNDENLIVSQLQLAFLKFHNRIVELLKGSISDAMERFQSAQRMVRWHYQWLVIHEFLPRVIGTTMTNKIFMPTGSVITNFVNFKEDPFIPVEFAVAAYRFGHSMVRPAYSINNNFPNVTLFGALPDLNVKTIQSAVQVGATSMNVTLLNPGWTIDWGRFFPMGGANSGNPVNPQIPIVQKNGFPLFSKLVDTQISPPLFTLPNQPANMVSLPLRNLKRGNAFSLSWGQNVAAALGETPLTDANLAVKDVNGQPIQFPSGRVPLWYYILREAEVLNGGKFLGPVGGRIVGEVFGALLAADAKSFVAQQPGWTPKTNVPVAITNKTTFTVADFIRFSQT